MTIINLLTEFPQKPKVLVVDDDWLNRELIQAYLANAGCEVTALGDGLEAWQAIQAGYDPDLVVSDVQMPGMDGFALTQKIKQELLPRFIPVVIVTALDMEEEKLRAIQLGADDFITKPFNAVMLLTRVRSLLRLKRLHVELEARNHLLRKALNRYVDEEVADIILEDPERRMKLGGESCQAAVLFADLRGFTSFTENHPAGHVVETLNRIFTELSSVIFETSGTFDKYLGDAIMAFYGAPVAREDDVRRALVCALEMQRRFAALQQNGLAAGLRGLGVGVHFGELIVGNIGSERVMDYTVIGDTVNIARRLQEAANPGEVLVSEAVLAQVPGAVAVPLPPRLLEGKTAPFPVFALQSV